ncbi:hypothetical protein [Actinomycetospora sp. CA-084318]|uniref:hypothetical protein n=1 Tax=Actinomycetospora sp. CA-084318 TaxID=3239892 RepID=UPI003D97856F
MVGGRDEWTGTLGPEVRLDADALPLRAIAGFSSDGSAGAFRGLTDEGDFWVKPLNNGQSPRVPVNEYIVGRLGLLVGAPVCEVQLVEVGPDFAAQEFAPGRFLEAGLASGSRDVPNVNPLRTFEHRQDDDNRRRHAGVYALYDWCWGDDDQWLYDWSDGYRLHSHDHAFFLPGPGADWTIEDLERCADQPHQLSADPVGLDVDAVRGYANRLNALTADEIRGMLRTVPTGWPVDQQELEALGWFLERRAPQVARRMAELAAIVDGRSTG